MLSELPQIFKIKIENDSQNCGNPHSVRAPALFSLFSVKISCHFCFKFCALSEFPSTFFLKKEEIGGIWLRS